MGYLKTNDFIAECDKSGKFQRTIYPPHRNLVPKTKMVNGEKVVVGYELAPKGYGQPHTANGNNMDIANFGAHYARRFRHNKCKRRYS